MRGIAELYGLPPRKTRKEYKGKTFPFHGEMLTVREAADRENVSTANVRNNMDRLGCSLEKAVKLAKTSRQGKRNVWCRLLKD